MMLFNAAVRGGKAGLSGPALTDIDLIALVTVALIPQVIQSVLSLACIVVTLLRILIAALTVCMVP